MGGVGWLGSRMKQSCRNEFSWLQFVRKTTVTALLPTGAVVVLAVIGRVRNSVTLICCLCVCLHPFVCLYVCLSVLSVCLSVCLSISLSVCLLVCLSVRLLVCLSVYLSVY